MSAKSEFLVPGDFLNAVSREALHALLSPYKAFFARHGLDLDTPQKSDLVWKFAVHPHILKPDLLPEELRQSLADVVALADPQGHNLLLELAASHGWDLGQRPERLTAQELSARAFVERPDLFNLAWSTLAINKTHDFKDYFDRATGNLAERLTPERKEKLLAEAKFHWKDRARGDFSEVSHVAIGGTLTFFVVHADLAKVHSVVDLEKAKRKLIRFQPETTDMVRFHPATGRLSVHTRYPKDADGYRAMFGRAFWDDPDRYAKYSTYTNQPLMQLGAAALLPENITGLDAVWVKEFSVMEEQRPEHQIVVKGIRSPDLLEHHLKSAREANLSRITELKLCFKFKDLPKEVAVTIRPPNQLKLPHNLVGADLLYLFLQQKGFSVPPPRGGER